MDSSSTPGQTIRLLLEIDRAPDGRLEGRIGTDSADAWSLFSGVLELLATVGHPKRLHTGARWALYQTINSL
jgi:hypothetical protein